MFADVKKENIKFPYIMKQVEMNGKSLQYVLMKTYVFRTLATLSRFRSVFAQSKIIYENFHFHFFSLFSYLNSHCKVV